MELIGQKYCPFATFNCASGEGFCFDCAKTLELLVKVHKLWDVTDRNIDLSDAIDGKTLTKSENCVTAGLKIIDY